MKTQETSEPAFCLGWNYMKVFPVLEIVWPAIIYPPFLAGSLSHCRLATFDQHKGVHLERSGGDQMAGMFTHNEYPLGTGHRYGIRWPMKFEMVVFAELC